MEENHWTSSPLGADSEIGWEEIFHTEGGQCFMKYRAFYRVKELITYQLATDNNILQTLSLSSTNNIIWCFPRCNPISPSTVVLEVGLYWEMLTASLWRLARPLLCEGVALFSPLFWQESHQLFPVLCTASSVPANLSVPGSWSMCGGWHGVSTCVALLEHCIFSFV